MRTDMQLYLRDALPGDVEDLVGLLLSGKLREDDDGMSHTGQYLDALREIDAADGNYLLVAELGGRAVGMLQLVTFRHFQHRGGLCAEVESVHVAEEVRNRGIGSRLLRHAVRLAAELGCYRFQLTSNNARDGAHRFYERNDFVATHPGYTRYLAP